MFIIANLGENEIKTNLKIDTQGLGLSDKEIVALDAFTLEKIEFADSKIDISVTPKNFRIIILKSIKQ
jgi:hypothetical protein